MCVIRARLERDPINALKVTICCCTWFHSLYRDGESAALCSLDGAGWEHLASPRAWVHAAVGSVGIFLFAHPLTPVQRHNSGARVGKGRNWHRDFVLYVQLRAAAQEQSRVPAVAAGFPPQDPSWPWDPGLGSVRGVSEEAGCSPASELGGWK